MANLNLEDLKLAASTTVATTSGQPDIVPEVETPPGIDNSDELSDLVGENTSDKEPETTLEAIFGESSDVVDSKEPAIEEPVVKTPKRKIVSRAKYKPPVPRAGDDPYAPKQLSVKVSSPNYVRLRSASIANSLTHQDILTDALEQWLSTNNY